MILWVGYILLLVFPGLSVGGMAEGWVLLWDREHG